MKRLTIIAGILVVCALLAPDRASAQTPFAVKAVAIEGGFYNPNLGFYSDNANYLVDFSTAPLVTAHLEAELFEVLTLRGSAGYWSQNADASIGLDDPANARTHDARLRIVPITATLYYSVPLARFQPMIGAGISQNFIQRTFERERIDGSTPQESFEANARDFSYHVVGGLHHQVTGPVWIGAEARYVFGKYEEDAGNVDLDGLQVGLSLRYHLGM